jgi:asparaginyl-tRNA synthetase
MSPKRIKVIELLTPDASGAYPYQEQEVLAMGWVRTRRGSKRVSFIELNDGSCLRSLQVVLDHALADEDLLKKVANGACIAVKGVLVASQGGGQPVELQARSLEVYGEADQEAYPMQKKEHSAEFLRENAHLRFRTNTFGAVFRIRHTLSYGIHQFFHERGFVYLHSPIITASDAEGAGEMFRVTTLNPGNAPRTPEGDVDWAEDFFGQPAHLTVSGQLAGELAALALSEVYTFGPTFRAENSNTSRHLAEFWMIEPEMAFYDLEDNMRLAEDLLKYLIRKVLMDRREDVEFLATRPDTAPGLVERLQAVLDDDFVRLDYTEAVEILQNSGRQFEFPVQWGIDLQSEHERYLVEQHFQKPVIVINYPKQIKAFYMRLNDDDRTVRAMDVLFPGVGEVIGGSQREERYDYLLARIRELHLPEEHYWWYLDTRRFGTAPHSGFGLGLERLMMFVTGLGNVRDLIPFPRTPGHAEF